MHCGVSAERMATPLGPLLAVQDVTLASYLRHLMGNRSLKTALSYLTRLKASGCTVCHVNQHHDLTTAVITHLSVCVFEEVWAHITETQQFHRWS